MVSKSIIIANLYFANDESFCVDLVDQILPNTTTIDTSDA
jgi:hypothetical protein